MTRWVAILVAFGAATLIAGAAWTGYSPGASPVHALEAQPPLHVETMVANKVGSYLRTRTYTGLVREARRSQISFQRGGQVVRLLVDEGEHVERGQELARLDDRHIHARQEQIAAQLAEASAKLEELLAGPRPESIAAKRAELAALQTQAVLLEKQLQRREQLLKSASIAHEEFEIFHYDFQAAKARAEVAQRQLDEMVAGTRDEQIAAQRARKAQLTAQLQDVRYELEDAELTAPFTGRVSRRFVDEGTVVAAGTPIIELVDDGCLEAWFGLPASVSETFRVGDQSEVMVENNSYDATVYALAPDVARDTRTRDAIFRLTDESDGVFPGQVVRLQVEERIDQAGYWLPTTALARGVRGLWSVYVVEGERLNGTIERRDVELLDTAGGESLVRGTLRPGDRVVVSGAHKVVVGQRVDAVEDTGSAP